MSQTERQPKETDKIKALLESYPRLQKRIDNTEKRIEALDLSMGAPSTSNMSGKITRGPFPPAAALYPKTKTETQLLHQSRTTMMTRIPSP